MKILLTGAGGQLGNELFPRLTKLGDVVAVDLDCRHSNAPGCQSLDLANAAALEVFLNRLHPDLVVNAGAYTAVDRAEQEPELAFAVNAEAPGRIARWAARSDALVVHYSTDYVFDGASDRPYREDDTPSPLNTYGESKLAGEHAIAAARGRHLVIRTSWVYSRHGSNFVLNMLKLARTRPSLKVVDDQVGCPTWARNLARVSVDLLGKRALTAAGKPGRTLHYCDADATSWYDFAQRVFATAVDLELLDRAPDMENVSSSEFPQVARRPHNSVLDTGAARKLGVRPAGLAESLRSCMEEWVDHGSD
ncbi:MAG: dTDP-4-dehydrorhamnose reductase [Xanthomonadales bacterium]|nr:dTDP-4-dehydrorhamnose reductase [Xanthomonadales bacterium]